MRFKPLLTVAIAIGLAGCSTVTIRPQQAQTFDTKPDFEQSRDFFFWGLKGEHTFDVKQICPNGVAQMQTQATFKDGLLTVITLGIYAPHTAKVWCSK